MKKFTFCYLFQVKLRRFSERFLPHKDVVIIITIISYAFFLELKIWMDAKRFYSTFCQKACSSVSWPKFCLLPCIALHIHDCFCSIFLQHRDDDDDSDHQATFAGGNVTIINTQESWDQKLEEAKRDGKIVSSFLFSPPQNHIFIIHVKCIGTLFWACMCYSWTELGFFFFLLFSFPLAPV